MLWDDPDPEIIEARLFELDSPFVTAHPTFREYAQPSFPPNRPLLEAVADLNRRIYREFTGFIGNSLTIRISPRSPRRSKRS